MRWKQYPDGAWAARVQGKRSKPNLSALDKLAGDGRWGFPAELEHEGTTLVASVVDGQPLLRSSRKSIAHPRKSTCRLVTKKEFRESTGTLEWASRRAIRLMAKKLRKKAERAKKHAERLAAVAAR